MSWRTMAEIWAYYSIKNQLNEINSTLKQANAGQVVQPPPVVVPKVSVPPKPHIAPAQKREDPIPRWVLMVVTLPVLYAVGLLGYIAIHHFLYGW